MHSLLIAACFIAIVLAPCLAAQWTGTIRLWEEREVETRVVAKRRVVEKRQVVKKGRTEVAGLESDELLDPLPSMVFQQRAALLKCARKQRVRQIHLPVDSSVMR
jgi:hypothetical protein